MYARVAGAMLAAGALKLLLASMLPPEALHVEVHGVAAYLGVLGGVYGIIVAFLLFVVWDQFNRVQMGLEKEASALEDLCHAAGFLSERDSNGRIRSAARQYIHDAVGDEPTRLARGEARTIAQKSFESLAQAVRGVAVATGKDGAVYDELLRALARVMQARDERLTVSTTRIPVTLPHP